MNLSFVEPDMLARVVTGLEEVKFGVSPVSSQQAEAIFRVASMQTKLRKLYVSFTDLSTIEPGLLAKAVSGMEEVQLGLSQVSSQQISELWMAIHVEETSYPGHRPVLSGVRTASQGHRWA